MAALSARIRGFLPFAGLCAAAVSLAGCNEPVNPAASAAAPNNAQPVASGYSPRPAAVAVTRMEGAPSPLQSQFMAFFNADAAQEDVALTDSAGARYLARGYLSAFLVDGGARLTYVWDIYDRTNHRAQRLNDEIALKGAAADPWALVDSAALSALAERSASELAAYLSNTPEALAAAAKSAAATAQNAGDAAKAVAAPKSSAPEPAAQALSYAPAR
ncbi:hypothetical protein [Rhodoblastus sp.]|uniref:hypothetical protein n=1 Tax=Rhodoblastus sp. TaxID=1962975 RepID=UPI0035AEB411